MSRSIKKGPYVDSNILKKVKNKDSKDKTAIKTWARDCTIIPEMIGYKFEVHNGKEFIEVSVSEEMVGHKLGEFSYTRKFNKHGGKIQKDIEQSAKGPA
ncbi:MAG: 30S ribosomal protein S19 [Candidatus Moranbacteria bacterium]|nr:30S ribosomal protein S19 [Candidatus Moranbacteria bacterium]